ncbi:Putative hypothetical protein [Helicobacter mustelae 12198]|uniref:Lipoprotein n=1 Tax=Helicobacter mustelae (strain ATCC 43772 / CCUG 25715 / CIP 103759 / LMG 18044 / NCTC 12198 / R85-136P) TaxID=679897 RepID=D3UHV6_HELM1|nr:Putative hypothetical protein [Helicobacter mustelae 12198]
MEEFVRIFGIFGLFLLFFVGCARLNMGYYSVLQKDYRFNINAPLIIMHNSNDLLSAYYVDLIIYELQRRGFNSVYKQTELRPGTARNAVYIRLFKDIRSYPIVSYNYSVINDGVTSSCYFYGERFYCDNSPQKSFNLTDFTQQTNYALTYHFTLDWYDLYTRKRIMYVDGSVQGKTCGYNYVFRDLIYNTINRMDFTREENYNYTSPLPYYWVCD